MPRVLHGLLQKAKQDAENLHHRLRVGNDGKVWCMMQFGWKVTGELIDPMDREDFLLSKLTQEDR
jgi:hypothetical protein